MRIFLFTITLLALCAAHLPAVPRMEGGDPPRAFTAAPLPPGGDVLRPDRGGPGLGWYLGPDLGVTYAMFVNGPMSLYAANPYYVQNPALAAVTPVSIPFFMTVDDGQGFGWYAGLTADVPLSDMVGLQLKPSIFTRNGSFANDTETPVVLGLNPDGTYIFAPENSVTHDELDWSFTHFGLDLLARFQLSKDSWYVLAGPSMNLLLSNEAEFRQEIRSADVYYVESFVYGPTGDIVPFMPNQYTQVSVTDEVEGCTSLLWALKAGIGTWIPLSDGLFLTPELTFAYPLTSMVEKSYVDTWEDRTASVGIAPNSPDTIPFTKSNDAFSVMTFTLTLGLRWHL